MGSAAGVRRGFPSAAMQAPYLERDEEHDLAVRWREARDQAALHRLTQAHMRLVIAIAARFRNFGLPMGDLVQEGHVGLLEAAARFEPAREVRFSTYATWVESGPRSRTTSSATGRSCAAAPLRRRRRCSSISAGSAPASRKRSQQPRQLIYAEIATAIGVSKSDVEVMDTRLSGPDMSLDAPLHESEGGASDRQDFLVDGGSLPDETVRETIDGERRLTWLRSALNVLNERELRSSRNAGCAMTARRWKTLGESLGISKERVRQIENRALEKSSATRCSARTPTAPASSDPSGR